MQGEGFPTSMKSVPQPMLHVPKVLHEYVSVRPYSEKQLQTWAKMLRQGVSFNQAKMVMQGLE